MVTGDAGIGKTRLTDELSQRAGERGAAVLVGRCYEGEGAPAYWPWVQIVRALVADREPQLLLAEMEGGAADIGQIVPEVGQRLPGLSAPPTLRPEQARFRLFDAVATFLRNVARKRPLVVVLDDLHAADLPTLLLLSFLSRELPAASILVLGTSRDFEIDGDHPLAGVSIQQQPIYERIQLGGLAESDARELAVRSAGGEIPEHRLRALLETTEGNPFFIGETARLLTAPGSARGGDALPIPEQVSDVLGQRLARLSTECHDLLLLAAAMGREFELAGLAAVSGLGHARTLELLDEAVRARLLDDLRERGRCRFAHALVRETLYAPIGIGRRVQIHRRIGQVLEQVYATRRELPVAELAHHFVEAAPGGDSQKAVDYSVRAAREAESKLAFEEAAQHYERALRVLELDPGDPARECGLIVDLGGCQMAARESEAAMRTLARAAALARRLRQPEQLARAGLLMSSRGLTAGHVDWVLVELLEEALEVLPGEDSLLRVEVLAALADSRYFADAGNRVFALTQEAVDMARRLGDAPSLAAALHARQFVLWGPERIEERIAIATESLRYEAECDDRQALIWTLNHRRVAYLEVGDVQAAADDLTRLKQTADDLGLPMLRGFARRHEAMDALLQGRFEPGERLMHETLELSQRGQDPNAVQFFGVQLFALRRFQGRLDEVEEAVEGFVTDYPATPTWRAALALLYYEGGRIADARAAFDEIARNDFADLPRDLNFFMCMTLLVHTCVGLEDASRARQLYEIVAPYEHLYVVVGSGALCAGSVARLLGMLAASTGEWDRAEAHFEQSLVADRKLGARPFIAETEHDYARVLLARSRDGDRARAVALIGRALHAARELGMPRLLEATLATKLAAQGADPGKLGASLHAVATAVHEAPTDLRSRAAPDGTVTLLSGDGEGFAESGDPVQRRDYLGIVQAAIAEHSGFELESSGGGMVIAFSSARRALHCAIDIQRALRVYNEQQPRDPIRARLGLHTGEATDDAERFFAESVVVAARIAAAASGGEILCSSLVMRLTESTGDFAFGAPQGVEADADLGSLYALDWRA
jgi:tetratricopeptide (TPR) repeat protein